MTYKAAEKARRSDVTTGNIEALRNKGLTISEITKELNCSINTVNRRLGIKSTDDWRETE